MKRSNTGYTILPADESDIPELAEVEVASKRESIPDCIEPFETDYTSRVSRWQTWFRGESPQTSRPERITFKATDPRNKIIGYLSGHLTTRFDLDAEIQSLYIVKSAQRNGLGTGLFEYFKRWLEENGARSLCVGINPKNKYRAFYVKQGGSHLNEHWIYWNDIRAR